MSAAGTDSGDERGAPSAGSTRAAGRSGGRGSGSNVDRAVAVVAIVVAVIALGVSGYALHKANDATETTSTTVAKATTTTTTAKATTTTLGAPVPVPNVVGLDGYAAAGALQSVGLKAKTQTVASSTVPIGKVISQTPAGGASAPGGSTVTLVASSGP